MTDQDAPQKTDLPQAKGDRTSGDDIQAGVKASDQAAPPAAQSRWPLRWLAAAAGGGLALRILMVLLGRASELGSRAHIRAVAERGDSGNFFLEIFAGTGGVVFWAIFAAAVGRYIFGWHRREGGRGWVFYGLLALLAPILWRLIALVMI